MKYKTGIVLSGGAARGFAHLGVLKALNESGIFPDVISGVSAGSIAGVFYADGYPPEEILQIFSQRKFIKYLELSVPKRGLLKMSGLLKIMKIYLKAKTFQELKIPLIVTIADLFTGKPLYVSDGELMNIVIASCSIPVIFNPVEMNDHLYVDGGILDNLPIKPLKGNCEKIIGVNINPLVDIKHMNGLLSLIERTFLVMNAKDTARKSVQFDLYIEPKELAHFSYTDIAKGKKMFDIAYQETKHALQSSSFF